MQSFISGSIRLGQRQGFCRWNSAHFKASTRAFLPTQSGNSLIHGTNDSISSENHLLQLLGIVDKEAVEEVKGQREISEIKPGYIVQLKVEVPENKRRVSTIKGIVIARRNAGLNTTFRIRRMVAGVGVESLFPLASSIATGLDQAPFLLAVGGGMVPPLQGGVISPIGGAVSRYSPNIKEIKVLDKKKVRRAKLYYLRNKMNALR
ncbi:hypothetical protein GOBAR_AA30132 [Gossypium barbadense]|uniref:Ribosomal protein L19 n=1 Tax=Gossypium barbadense TaxID=3634 RepID=A0A2P5WHI6_GOSBA|nr:hypothetical protein GOBAR_AA30132 [Gossypium barbadense]